MKTTIQVTPNYKNRTFTIRKKDEYGKRLAAIFEVQRLLSCEIKNGNYDNYKNSNRTT